MRDGSPCYLLGIKMQIDPGHAVGLDSSRHNSFGEVLEGASTLQVPNHIALESSDGSSLSGGSETPILFTSCSDFGIHCDAAGCLIDTMSPDFNILKYNTAFASLGGMSSVGSPATMWFG